AGLRRGERRGGGSPGCRRSGGGRRGRRGRGRRGGRCVRGRRGRAPDGRRGGGADGVRGGRRGGRVLAVPVGLRPVRRPAAGLLRALPRAAREARFRHLCAPLAWTATAGPVMGPPAGLSRL